MDSDSRNHGVLDSHSVARLEYIYSTVNDWMKLSDAKAGFVLAANGIMVAALASNLKDLLVWYLRFASLLDGTGTILVILLIATLAASVGLAFASVLPRLTIGGPLTHIYFGDIAKHLQAAAKARVLSSRSHNEVLKGSTELLRDELIMLPDATYAKELADQIVSNAAICWTKYRRVTWSIWLLAATALEVILLFLVRLYPLVSKCILR